MSHLHDIVNLPSVQAAAYLMACMTLAMTNIRSEQGCHTKSATSASTGSKQQQCVGRSAGCHFLLHMQDHNVREELLVHIAKEATVVREAGWRALKVVSDIDDTFLCSGGSFPSGQPASEVRCANCL